jgi:hypothetical protein
LLWLPTLRGRAVRRPARRWLDWRGRAKTSTNGAITNGEVHRTNGQQKHGNGVLHEGVKIAPDEKLTNGHAPGREDPPENGAKHPHPKNVSVEGEILENE